MNQPTKIVPIGQKFSSQLVNQKPVYEKKRRKKNKPSMMPMKLMKSSVKWI